MEARSWNGQLTELAGDKLNLNKLKNMRSDDAKLQYLRAIAISNLVEQIADKFIRLDKVLLDGTFDSPLITHIESKELLDDILNITREQVYLSRGVVEVEAAGFEVIGGLLDVFVSSLDDIMDFDKPKRPDPRSEKLMQLVPVQFLSSGASTSNYDRNVRGIIDFVCGMTDSYAVSLFRKIKGISLS